MITPVMIAYAVSGDVGLNDIEKLCADAVDTARVDDESSYTVTCYMGDPGEVPDVLPIHEQDQLSAALRDGADRIIVVQVEPGCSLDPEYADDDDDD